MTNSSIKYVLSFSKQIKALVLTLLVILTIISLAIIILTTFSKAMINYKEGWNIYHALETIEGKPIYEKDFTPFNYPPLSFYMIGFFSTIFKNPLIVNRSIASISLIFISTLTAYIIKLMGGKNYEALLAGLFCINSIIILNTSYIAESSQLIAHLVSLTAFIIYLKKFSSDNLKFFLIALLLTISLFMKHNLIALPIALLIDAYFFSRRAFSKLTIYLLTLSGLFTLSIQYLSGGDFISSILFPRMYSLYRLAISTLYIFTSFPILIVALYLAAVILNHKVYRKFALYLIISFVTGILFTAGEGIDFNIFYDVFISASLFLGILIIFSRSRKKTIFKIGNWLYGIIFVLVFTYLIFFIVGIIDIIKLLNYSKLEKTIQEDVKFTQNHKGNVLCENLLLCYLAGKKFTYDPFLMKELMRTDKNTEKIIITKLKNKDYALIQTYFPVEKITPTNLSLRFSASFIYEMKKHYHLTRKSALEYFYSPN